MFNPNATYKGRLLTSLSREELLVVLFEQTVEVQFMLRFVKISEWHMALRDRAEKTIGISE